METSRTLSADKAAHIPTRTCVGCGAKRAPGEMLRVTSKAGATPEVVLNNRVSGRSAYLCCDRKCVDKVFGRRALERSLKLKNSTPQHVKDDIVRAIEAVLLQDKGHGM